MMPLMGIGILIHPIKAQLVQYRGGVRDHLVNNVAAGAVQRILRFSFEEEQSEITNNNEFDMKCKGIKA